jgi:hypothetical protein
MGGKMSVLKGDFIGFTYNGIHSSTLGIIRTSSGDRYNEVLLPTMQDTTIQVPGGDGTYYFGSYYAQKPFTVNFAFDELTETQLRVLRQTFADQKVHDLIFDELPYKVYSAKVTPAPTIKYICFNDGQGARIYKGEGTLSFVAYSPLARSRYKFLSDYTAANIPEWSDGADTEYYKNLDEWSAASGMSATGAGYDTFSSASLCAVINPGDVPVDFLLMFPKDSTNIGLQKNGSIVNSISLNIPDSIVENWLLYDSAKHLLSGVTDTNYTAGNFVSDGNTYNRYITNGDFFQILLLTAADNGRLVVTTTTTGSKVKYNYLYY